MSPNRWQPGDTTTNDTAARFQGYLVAQLVLGALGALALAVADWGVEWWLDAGFWGAFAGGAFVAGLGVLLRNEVEGELDGA